jgi:hypothetical protein
MMLPNWLSTMVLALLIAGLLRVLLIATVQFFS